MLAWLTSLIKPNILPYPALKADISFVKEQDISLFYNILYGRVRSQPSLILADDKILKRAQISPNLDL